MNGVEGGDVKGPAVGDNGMGRFWGEERVSNLILRGRLFYKGVGLNCGRGRSRLEEGEALNRGRNRGNPESAESKRGRCEGESKNRPGSNTEKADTYDFSRGQAGRSGRCQVQNSICHA